MLLHLQFGTRRILVEHVEDHLLELLDLLSQIFVLVKQVRTCLAGERQSLAAL